MRHGTIKWLFFFLAASSMPMTPAMANSDCPSEPVKYCWCKYEQALEDMKDMQGNSEATIKQRVSAVKKALDQCLGRSTDKVTDDIKKL